MKVPQYATREFRFRVPDADGGFINIPADNVQFTVRQTPSTSSPVLIEKSYPDGGITFDFSEGYYNFTITPEDTAELAPGTYRFSIIVDFGGASDPIKKNGDFVVEEVAAPPVTEEEES